jgi:hypothetical protein
VPAEGPGLQAKQSLLVALDPGIPTLQPELKDGGQAAHAYAGANDLFQVGAPIAFPESSCAHRVSPLCNDVSTVLVLTHTLVCIVPDVRAAAVPHYL